MSNPNSMAVAQPVSPAIQPAAAPEVPAAAPSDDVAPDSAGLLAPVGHWVRTEGAWWASSFVFHMLGVCVLMLLNTAVNPATTEEAPSFDEAKVDSAAQPPPVERFEVGDAPLDPTELTTESLTLSQPLQLEQTEEINDDNTVFTPRGGGVAALSSGPSLGGAGGFDILGIGAGLSVRGRGGGVGTGLGTGTQPGTGGSGTGFGSRGTGVRKAMVGSFGGTRQSERAVAAALSWLARHQNPSDGGWSLSAYRSHCKDGTCTGPGSAAADAGATAMGLLPFLAAGQTHMTKGSPYRKTVKDGLGWLMKNQDRNGDLSAKAGQPMYSHGLATITLCEAYGLTKDRMIGMRAQSAINYIESAQNPTTGGWRYVPLQDGDTSVVGWQVMALKSAQMAGLSVNPKCFEGARQWLKSASAGNGGQFCYTPGGGPTPPMTAVGLLCSQYLGVRRDDPIMAEGAGVLMANLPDNSTIRDLYYWYYATQVMHNVPGPDWDAWNRKMRRTLIENQCKQGCATGSWDPDKPTPDRWGTQGGRLMVTSLAALSLEVYYRYLPLYKLDTEAAVKPAAKKPAAEPKRAAEEKSTAKAEPAAPEKK